MDNKIKTRFAPSPTGYMHIGNLRTALYAYLLSKNTGGKFVLRIEDTDQVRFVEGATDIIIDTLKITGLSYDEGPNVGGEFGPYVQSERANIYKEHSEKLIDSGHAYRCFCTKERLETLHEDGEIGGYDRHCRNLSESEVQEKLRANTPFIVRQKMPLEGTTSYYDEVFGEVKTENKELQDQVLMKADGMPTYNFAHVVDDYLMQITHVVRGSEYITSTPKYVLLYDAFNWQRPKYVHLPLLMGRSEDGSVSKLSKRHGAVSFADLLEQGYLPNAILNYIALLGWCPKDSNEEFFTLGELCDAFSIDGVSKSPSVFDYDKLLWFNGEYIKKLSAEQFLQYALPYLKQALPSFTGEQHEKVAALLSSRTAIFSEIPQKLEFLAKALPCTAEDYVNKKNKTTPQGCLSMLEGAYSVLESVQNWQNDELFAALKAYAEQSEIKAAALMFAVRIAVARISVTPGGASELMSVLGKEETLKRISEQIEMLKNC